MKHIQELTERLKSEGHPGVALGQFLLQHTNRPEYLVDSLKLFLEAAQADLEEKKESDRKLSAHISLSIRPDTR